MEYDKYPGIKHIVKTNGIKITLTKKILMILNLKMEMLSIDIY